MPLLSFAYVVSEPFSMVTFSAVLIFKIPSIEPPAPSAKHSIECPLRSILMPLSIFNAEDVVKSLLSLIVPPDSTALYASSKV